MFNTKEQRKDKTRNQARKEEEKKIISGKERVEPRKKRLVWDFQRKGDVVIQKNSIQHPRRRGPGHSVPETLGWMLGTSVIITPLFPMRKANSTQWWEPTLSQGSQDKESNMHTVTHDHEFIWPPRPCPGSSISSESATIVISNQAWMGRNASSLPPGPFSSSSHSRTVTMCNRETSQLPCGCGGHTTNVPRQFQIVSLRRSVLPCASGFLPWTVEATRLINLTKFFLQKQQQQQKKMNTRKQVTRASCYLHLT